MGKEDLKLDWASYSAAEYACKRWHYSRSISTPPRVMIGVWEKGVFCGVIVFGRGANKNLLSPYGLNQTHGCELTRVALSHHSNHVSRIIAIALKMLKGKFPLLRIVVSYADPEEGHIGGIYQAGNWLYSGKSSDSMKLLTPGGDVIHKRLASATGFRQMHDHREACLRFDQCTRIKTEGKYRYLMPLDEEIRQQVKLLAKPYPKRTKHAMTETIGTAAGKHRPVRSNSEVA